LTTVAEAALEELPERPNGARASKLLNNIRKRVELEVAAQQNPFGYLPRWIQLWCVGHSRAKARRTYSGEQKLAPQHFSRT